jgi:hypothetical protein
VRGLRIRIDHRTDLVEYKHEALALVLAPADLVLDEARAAALRVTGVEHEEDDVGLFDDLVQLPDVVPAHLLERLRARRRVFREHAGGGGGLRCSGVREGRNRRLDGHRRVRPGLGLR